VIVYISIDTIFKSNLKNNSTAVLNYILRLELHADILNKLVDYTKSSRVEHIKLMIGFYTALS